MNSKYNIFKQIILECDYDNTYKMAWAKSLTELSSELDLTNDVVEIWLEDIAVKYIKYYWDQIIFFNLNEGPRFDKIPLILSSVKHLIKQYFEHNNSNVSELFEYAVLKFEKIGFVNIYNKTIKQVINILKKDVSWRFLYLDGVNTQIYSYEKGNDFIKIETSLLNEIKENKENIYNLINYRWGLILENFNSDSKINKKIKFINENEINKDFSNKFKLISDTKEYKCFVCEKIMSENASSLKTVIPWYYIYPDYIWSLVYVCKNCFENYNKN